MTRFLLDMNTLRLVLRLLAAAVCVALVSCIDGYEEYWLERDGSGRAEIVYDVPASFASTMGGVEGVENLLDRFVRETPTLHEVTREVTRRGDRLTVSLKARFKSVTDLIDAVSGESVLAPSGESSPLDPLIGDFDISQTGTRVSFRRTVRPGRALPGSALMPASKLKGRRLVYILHLPVPAAQSNATRTEDGGRTMVWECPLDSGKLRPQPLEFVADLPLPWGWIAGGGGLGVVCLAAAVARLRRMWRGKGRPVQESPPVT